jgi:hypothetical protein
MKVIHPLLAAITMASMIWVPHSALAQTQPRARSAFSYPEHFRVDFIRTCVDNNGAPEPLCSCTLRAQELVWPFSLALEWDAAMELNPEQHTQRQAELISASVRIIDVCTRNNDAFQ